jgi:D-sedoheptulose 7-phosphate isomerase
MPDRPAEALRYIKEYKSRCKAVVEAIPDDAVAQLIGLLGEARQRNRQVFVCGNGGSAATCSHFSTDLGKCASVGREKRFRVISLAENMSWIMAVANDDDYSQVFVEQLRNYAGPGDLLIAFSGSGNSANVLRAVEWANQNGLITAGVTGRPGGRLGEIAHHPVFAESSHMASIEDAHFVIQHILGYYFMEVDGD